MTTVPPDPASVPDPASAPAPEASWDPSAPVRTNRLAAIALVFGICGVIVPLMPSMVAIVLGWYARSQIRHTKEYGAGMALASVIIGCIGFVLWVLVILLLNYVAHQCNIGNC
jgi:ABC-type Fe3+ transport system permease subunit